jgi:hypothetical protein
MIITIKPRTFKGWTARFTGGDQPQGCDVPLPFSECASFRQVAESLLERFPDAIVRMAGDLAMIYGGLLILEDGRRVLVSRPLGGFLHEALCTEAAERWIDEYNAPLSASRAVRYITDWEV